MTTNEGAEYTNVDFYFCGRRARCQGGVLNLHALFGHEQYTLAEVRDDSHRGRQGVARHPIYDGCFLVESGKRYIVVSTSKQFAGPQTHVVVPPGFESVIPPVPRVKKPHSVRSKQQPIPEASGSVQTQEKLLVRQTPNDQVLSSLSDLVKPSVSQDLDDVPITLLQRRAPTQAAPSIRSPSATAFADGPAAQTPQSEVAPLLSRRPQVPLFPESERGVSSSLGAAAFPQRAESAIGAGVSGIQGLHRGGRAPSMSMPPPEPGRRLEASPSPAPAVQPIVIDSQALRPPPSGPTSALATPSRVGRVVSVVATSPESRSSRQKKNETAEERASRKEKKKREKRTVDTVLDEPARGPPRILGGPSPGQQGPSISIVAAVEAAARTRQRESSPQSGPSSLELPPQRIAPSKRTRSPSTPPNQQSRRRPSTFDVFEGDGRFSGSIGESPALGFTRVDTKLTQFSLDPSEDSDSGF